MKRICDMIEMREQGLIRTSQSGEFLNGVLNIRE